MNDDSFFSINRLVEFGMGMAVAQQMVNTMNSAMTNMHVPGTMTPMQTGVTQFYYAIIDGYQAGPFSEQELSRLIAEKKVVKETYIWKPGLIKWEIAEKLPSVTNQIIHEHEEMAEKLAIVLYALGLVSLIGLYLNFINHAKASIVSYFAMVIAIVGVFVGKQAGTTGGEIRHTEIRANANTAAVDQNGVGEEGDDD